MVDGITKEFQKLASPRKAGLLSRFFKTGKGEYAEGDSFYGVMVPQTRVIAKRHVDDISFARIERLLVKGKHEERLCMLLILVARFKKGDAAERKKIFDFYLAHTNSVNNWDLVDLSAHHIVGAYLAGRSDRMKVLTRLAKSKSLWERRIAIIASFYDIYQKDCVSTFLIADILLHDTHDLIHKAVGWMLREVGKRCGEPTLEAFLKPRASTMPRTMLRYAIEKFSEQKRQAYLRMV